jgi:putative membrane protein
MLTMVRFVAYVVATVVATLALGTISDRLISFDRAEAVLVFGVVLGLINAYIKPVVNLLAFPLTCLTFGLFAIVVNTVLFWSGAWISRNFDVAANLEVSWWGALFGSMLISVASGIIFTVIDE